MKTNTKDKTLLDAIDDLLASPKDVVPAGGWHTVNEWCEKTGLGRTSTLNKLREKVSAGTWEERPFPRLNRGGTLQPIPHYRKKPL